MKRKNCIPIVFILIYWLSFCHFSNVSNAEDVDPYCIKINKIYYPVEKYVNFPESTRFDLVVNYSITHPFETEFAYESPNSACLIPKVEADLVGNQSCSFSVTYLQVITPCILDLTVPSYESTFMLSIGEANLYDFVEGNYSIWIEFNLQESVLLSYLKANITVTEEKVEILYEKDLSIDIHTQRPSKVSLNFLILIPVFLLSSFFFRRKK